MRVQLPIADTFALAPEPWMREWVREMKLLWVGDPDPPYHGFVARLIHAAWNPELKQLVGWFYEIDSLLAKPPYHGRYIDTDACDFALMSDIKQMHEEFMFWKQGFGEREFMF